MAKAPKPLVLSGTVTDGKLEISPAQKAQMVAALKKWPDLPVAVTVAPFVETRRSQQNRYYHGCVVKMIAEETGQPADDVHAFLKGEFNTRTMELTDPHTGEVIEKRIALSTAKLSVEEFVDYTERCKLWAAEFLSIVIPESDKDYANKRERKAAA